MNIQSRYPTTPDEFLRWNEGREGKWDLVRGRIVDMMVRVSKHHAVIAGNLLTILRTKLTTPPYFIASADFGVKTATSVCHPDVMVDGERGSGSDLAATAPVLIAEVLSPSTMATDFGEKVEEYKTISSLGHYLVLAQDEPRIWLWTRNAEANWGGPEMLAGEAETVSLSALGSSLLIGDIYAGLVELSK